MLSFQELTSSTLKELMQELTKAKESMLKIRLHCKTRHEKDTSKAQKNKKYIARIKTAIKQLEIEEAKKMASADVKNND